MFVEPNQSTSKHDKALINKPALPLNICCLSQTQPLTARSICGLPGFSAACEIVNFRSATILSALPAINNSDRSSRAAPVL